ncbi:MAG: hypothetical protein R2694_05920 [Ilumatobacteraceae bacterium]|nr:hypothetical protein [Ilumatobacter sp.]
MFLKSGQVRADTPHACSSTTNTGWNHEETHEMRRSEKSWLEFDELTRPFLEPGSEESVTSVAVELRDRMVKVEQQVLAQYTATAAYATLAQQGVEQARAESRADLDRTQATVFGLLDTLRSDVNRRLEALENRPDNRAAALTGDVSGKVAAMEERMRAMVSALEGCVHENMLLRQQVDELLRRQMEQDGWLVSSGSASELSLH